MLRRVDEQHSARERMERLAERNARRRARGKPEWNLDERWPVSPALSETETFVLEPGAGIAPPRPPRRSPETAAGDGPRPEPQRRVALNTAIFGAATGLSRVLGLVREVVAAYYFGAAGRINAFTVAFQIPNLVRALVADAALSSAFVPVFSELLEKGERKRETRSAQAAARAECVRHRSGNGPCVAATRGSAPRDRRRDAYGGSPRTAAT